MGELGNLYFSLGEFAEASSCWKESLTISREIGDIAGMCPTLFNIGRIHMQNQEPQQAMSAWISAYVFARKLDLAEALEHLDGLAKQIGGSGLEIWEQLAAQFAPDDDDPTPKPP